MKKIPTRLRDLIKKSESGSFLSSFQVAKIYESGIGGVDKNPDTAAKYYQMTVDQVKNDRLSISSIKLINYKGFDDFTIDFARDLTVIIGNNGGGKSSILDAVRKALSHLTSRIATRSANGEDIELHEIKKGSHFSTIVVSFNFSGEVFSAELSQSDTLAGTTKKSDYEGINLLGSILKLCSNNNPKFHLPILASYTVDRSIDVTTKDIDKSEEILDDYIWDRASSYKKSLTGKADFRLFFRWFKELTEERNSSSTEKNKINEEIKAKEKFLNSSELKNLMKHSTGNTEIEDYVRKLMNDIEDLKRSINESSMNEDVVLDNVKNAIYSFLPGFSNMKIQRKPLDLIIEKDGISLSVLQLSQGEKSLLALVADIARRLTILNPSHEDPLKGPGIVTLDELDLHLHPSWQQLVLSRLKETFPNVSFIVTTHSPQICHTVESDKIWLLRDWKKFRAPKGAKGAVSSWVLKELFDVPVRPPNDEMTIAYKKYRELVYADKFSDTETLNLRKKLDENFGHNHPDFVELDLYIENRKWEQELEKDS